MTTPEVGKRGRGRPRKRELRPRVETEVAIKYEDAEEVKSLPSISPHEHDFIEKLMFDPECEGHAVKAYRKVWPESGSTVDSVRTMAAKKMNNPRIQKWIEIMRMANLDRMICSKEHHMSELAKLRELSKASGNMGAAIQAEVSRGKVAGHYVERKEITHKRESDLDTLIELARSGEKEIAMKYAKELGLVKELKENADGVWEEAERIPCD